MSVSVSFAYSFIFQMVFSSPVTHALVQNLVIDIDDLSVLKGLDLSLLPETLETHKVGDKKALVFDNG